MSKETSFKSALYKGRVTHTRFFPARHRFNYPLFMFWLNPDELPTLTKHFWQLGTTALNWARFRRADYLGKDTQTVSESVRRKIAELSGHNESDFDNAVTMLCHLRYFGFYFSPLNLYFTRRKDNVPFMLAEVSNTPWNERHYYLLNLNDCQPHDKAFHVSPFNSMEQLYRWRVRAPDPQSSHTIVNIESWQKRNSETDESEKIFSATLNLERIELNQKSLTRVLLGTPIQTLSIVIGIYWQALRLFLKKVPLYPHPDRTRHNSQSSDLAQINKEGKL